MDQYIINFYEGDMGDERYICSCDDNDFMDSPSIGDMISLPVDVDDEEKDVYVIKQKYIENNSISYFCKKYCWGDD